MSALRASTSHSIGFGISPFSAPPTRRSSSSTHRRHVVFASAEPSEKSVEIMRKFSEQYARKSGTYFCMDKGVTAVVIKGLAEHRDTLGAPLCPCRHYDDKAAEVEQGFWNCPCVPMRERYIVLYCIVPCLMPCLCGRLSISLGLTGRSATACFFSPLIMILLEKNR
nr:ferredoxin-thioredoxin reductase catalytic chain, chloroplastic [Ipomoea batatas]